MTDREGKTVTFAAEKLIDIVGITEAQELIAKVLRQRPDDEDKKKSDSQSPFDLAGSASPVPESTDAETNRTSSNQ